MDRKHRVLDLCFFHCLDAAGVCAFEDPKNYISHVKIKCFVNFHCNYNYFSWKGQGKTALTSNESKKILIYQFVSKTKITIGTWNPFFFDVLIMIFVAMLVVVQHIHVCFCAKFTSQTASWITKISFGMNLRLVDFNVLRCGKKCWTLLARLPLEFDLVNVRYPNLLNKRSK